MKQPFPIVGSVSLQYGVSYFIFLNLLKSLYDEYVCHEDEEEEKNDHSTGNTGAIRNVVKELCRNEANYAQR